MEHLTKFRHLFPILAWGIFIISFLWMAKALLLGYYPDFVTQYVVPKLVFSGVNPYTGGEGLYTPQVYPPIAILLFWPLTLLPLATASYFYTFCSIVCLVFSAYLLLRMYDEKFLSVKSLILMTLVFVYFPVKFTLGMGQVNHFILLLLVVSLWFLKAKQEFRAGIFLGLSIAIKLFPLFLPLYFFIKIKGLHREFRDKFHWSGFLNLRLFSFKLWLWPSQVNENVRLMGGMFCAFLVAIALAALLIPMHLNLHFLLEVLPNLANSWKLDYYNQALSGFVGRSFGTGDVGTLLKLVFSAVISLSALYAVSKNERTDFLTVSLKFGTLIIVSILVNTFSWQHHYVWMIIPSIAIFYFIYRNRLNNKYFIVLLAGYFLTAINFQDPLTLPILLQSHGFLGALILWFLCLRLLFLKQEK